MEDRLRYILTLTNDWLKFAETKNAALLVFAGALAIGVVQRLNPQTALNIRSFTAIGLLLLAAAASCALTSFIPILRPEKTTPPGQPSDTDNLLFYGHIAKYTPTAYIERLATITQPLQGEPGIAEHYAQQIITNARIATRKYTWYTRGVVVGIIAIMTMALAGLLQLLAVQ